MQVSQLIATDKMLGREPQRGDDARHNRAIRRVRREYANFLENKLYNEL